MDIRLYNRDCFKVLPKIGDKSVHLIFSDLPYGKTVCKWDQILSLENLWKEYNRILIDNGVVIFTGNQPFTTQIIQSNPRLFRYELIWYKTKATGFMSAKIMPNRSHENILVFYKKLPTYNPQKYSIDPKFHVKGKHSLQTANFINIKGTKLLNYQYLEDGTRYPDSVLCFPSESSKGMHPTQKPVSLLNFLILSYTNKFDTVLDHCMGSGTTGVSCVKTERRFIGIEKDKGYFKLAKSRISKAQKEKVETLFSDLALSS
ncbi:site-specific DNA-methyltransferase (plasmid) [Leptospira interrogans]|uniref:DNA-methyltransferase n=1 Tax=Leptospira interrogans TaxID=173 RepID=UPI00034D5D9F|nr:site-specific DNA-methyltransferase [Leptospira interrogans]KGE21727.1 cytosine methyltransferase [Leptospira interrogans serovar Lai]ULG90795.1 site-specific DNA-methyltransferase [Leptospira interrogans]UML82892.1 site-specific DNA-methyltransferase [Leptospira interrogans]